MLNLEMARFGPLLRLVKMFAIEVSTEILLKHCSDSVGRSSRQLRRVLNPS